MSDTLLFKTFCIEQYKHKHKLTGADTVKLFNKYGVSDYLEACYDALHTTGAEYIVEDIDLYLQARR